MKNIIKLLFTISLIITMASCAALTPGQDYAKQHQSKEFTSWKQIGKKMDACDKKKPKEHASVNKWWKK